MESTEKKETKLTEKLGLDNPRVQSFLTNIYAFLLINAILWLVVRPVLADSSRLRRQVKEYTGLKEELSAKIQQIGTQYKEIQEHESDLFKANLLYPYDDNFSYLLISLDQLAQKIGVDMFSVSFNKQASVRLQKDLQKGRIVALVPVTFNVSFEGDYLQMLRYIKELEQMPFSPQILTLDYSNKDTDKGQKRVYSIAFVVYGSKNLISTQDLYDTSAYK